MSKIEENIKGESQERLKLDFWGRKWNMVVRGVPGLPNEKRRDTDKKVRDFF